MKRLIPSLLILLTLALIVALFVHERQGQLSELKVFELTRKLMKQEQLTRRQSAQIIDLEKNLETLKAEAEALRERLHAVAAAAPEPRPDSAPAPTPSEPTPDSTQVINQLLADPQLEKQK